MASVWFLIRILRFGSPIRLLSRVLIDFLCRNTATEGNANDFVDELLQNLRNTPDLLRKIEPIKLADVNEKDFELYNGFVKGLSSMHRFGDCTLAYKDGELFMIAEVAISDIIIDFKYAKKLVFFWTQGHAILSVDSFAVKMEISIKDSKASFSNLEVIHLGKYRLKKMTGVGIELNWLLKLIANAVVKNSRQKIINALEQFMQEISV